MRVIAGTARSMPLAAPEGLNTRPTTDRIKETLFNILQTEVPGSIFLDLFSGSGAIGIEALSRGAKKAYFVDNAKEALNCIKNNLEFTKLGDKAVVIGRDSTDAIYSVNDVCDIIFMDPPYDSDAEESVMRALSNSKCVDENTLIIIEADAKKDLSHLEDYGFVMTREKNYKTNKHVFFKKEV